MLWLETPASIVQLPHSECEKSGLSFHMHYSTVAIDNYLIPRLLNEILERWRWQLPKKLSRVVSVRTRPKIIDIRGLAYGCGSAIGDLHESLRKPVR